MPRRSSAEQEIARRKRAIAEGGQGDRKTLLRKPKGTVQHDAQFKHTPKGQAEEIATAHPGRALGAGRHPSVAVELGGEG